MELGVIRDLQGQATAKSGASKQCSSFLEATTMTLFTISESEKASYGDQIHSFLGDDPFLKQFLPIDPATRDLLNLVKDGVLLCSSILLCQKRESYTKRVLNQWQRNENHTLCLNSSKAIGCTVVNIGTQDLVEGRPHLLLGLISLIIKIQLLVELSLRKTPQLVELVDENHIMDNFRSMINFQDVEELMELAPEKVFLKWMNFHPKKAGYEKPVLTFSSDLKVYGHFSRDGKAYAYLLNILAPDHCNPSMLDTKDPKERARVILDHAERESAILKSFVALAIPRDVELYECSCLLINGCKISLYRFSFPALSQKYVKGKVIVGDLPPVTGKLKAFIFNKEEIAGILNELYGDLSNEIESEDFLKEATYSFYCMELGVIRDLQGQATAKSGASKQSSSFLKATTMTLFTISESEKASYADQIDSYLGDDPFLKQFLPIDPATKDLFYLLFSEQQHGRLVDRRWRRQSHHLKQGGFDLWSERDGPQLFETPDGVPSARFSPKGAVQTAGLLESSHKRFTQSCERWSAFMLVNIVVPGIIDERAVNIRTHGIGCTVVNIRTRDLVGGRPASNMEKFGNLNWTKLFLLTFQRLNRSWKR
ncbi:hypothetical protein DKX38_022451 [Salix brachista]|uniref:Calponin-homology (CH) domain-containing protein n=1 Tax=Salix brachista TaxID=2182728 RepID=A0A5N5K090_9ROSI|nr:hypothetical protein DKX38_022451 [Salix brachista]